MPFEDERISFKDWPAFRATTPQGLVPLMTLTDKNGKSTTRTQSNAMLRYVGAQKPVLYPQDKFFDIDEALGIVGDLEASFEPPFNIAYAPSTLGYPADFAKADEGKQAIKQLRTKWVKEEMPKQLDYLVRLLDKNGGKWLASTDGPTIVDCKAVPLLRSFTRGVVENVPENCLETHPKIVAYVKRFCALGPVKGRYTSGVY
jgi:glutathione S-transferase